MIAAPSPITPPAGSAVPAGAAGAAYPAETAAARPAAAPLSAARKEAAEAGRRDGDAARPGTGGGSSRAPKPSDGAGGRPAPRIALFMGAGASVPYGKPTTRDLRDKIADDGLGFPRKDLLNSDRFPDIEHVLSALDTVIRFAESPAGKLYEAYERFKLDGEQRAALRRASAAPKPVSLIPGLQAPALPDPASYAAILAPYRTAKAQPATPRRKEGLFPPHVSRSRKSKRIIEKLITDNYRWDGSFDGAAKKILNALFGLARSSEGHVTVFTTNYDTAVEEYCGNAKRIERIDGFRYEQAKRRHVWDGEFVPRIADCHTKAFLFKLHGSMNWLAGGAADRKAIVQKPDAGASDDPARDMYIRPSTDTKDEATQREPYATILREFAERLPSFDACVVIGYSFRDPHISDELVKFAKSGKALVVLSPTAEADFKKYALKGGMPGKKTAWKGGKKRHILSHPLGGEVGTVYALNVALDKDRVDDVVADIRSLLRVRPHTPRQRRAGRGERR